ncbi:DUF3822 family protein [Flammeovirga yaeyamensis]|uniref:DUF3822 family protein n=1 Tax=Flammeovirga yaeyamensis TaxID=367791 RepID=A0AAX1N5Z2_9BACT|nr:MULTISPECIES: DUF3822 family protein [Flammeovirga]ANQ51308.2 DUF3822 family protein [Flammeovirga sp. MY04]MBB3698363.1 hypothetical protein [Flammeovirga yaeyamensis]NMF34285.1 DUF3822 family protein [Flammeovirga yaeyamensis]QWG01268.1 DUF3822 family protein [Flammeovirga yaeyamensis]
MEDLLFESVRYSVHSDSFDVAQLANYSLHLRIHQSCLTIGVFDAENNECLVLESYHYDTAQNTTALIVNLHNIVQKHSFLNAAFWKNVHIISALPSFAFVPEGIHDEESKQNILSLISKFHQKKDNIHVHPKSGETELCFAIPKELEEWLSDMYSNSQVSYNHTTESFIVEANALFGNVLHCYIDVDTILITKSDDEKVRFANTFKYKTPQDLLYFVLFVLEELNIDQQEAEVVIWGEVDFHGESIKTLKKFINKVSAGTRPTDVRFAYQFDQEPQEQTAIDIIGNMKLNK